MAEIRWIDRDEQGKICGHFARKQREGQESIAEDAPEYVAWEAAMKQTQTDAQEAERVKQAKLTQVADEFDAIKSKVNKHENWTPTVETTVPSDRTVLMGILAWAIKQGYKP